MSQDLEPTTLTTQSKLTSRASLNFQWEKTRGKLNLNAKKRLTSPLQALTRSLILLPKQHLLLGASEVGRGKT
jgi:hypothetical protein